MTADQIEKLKALALAAEDAADARPGEWYNVHQIADGITFDYDAAFIAGCGPAAVLELIAKHQKLKIERDTLRQGYESASHRVIEMEDELARLRAEKEKA